MKSYILTMLVCLSYVFSNALADGRDTVRKPDIQFAEPNYIISGIGSGSKHSNDKMLADVNNQVKLRISLDYRLLGNVENQTGLYFKYTQNSFWNLYDQSRPFISNDYRPELFFQLNKKSYAPGELNAPAFRLSLVHESNGMSGSAERGWNKVSSTVEFGSYQNRGLYGNFSLWRVIDVNGKNKDLRHYAGDGEFRIGYFSNDNESYAHWGLNLIAHYRLRYSEVTSTEWTLFLNPFGQQRSMWKWVPAFTMQFFRGTGENLLNYASFSQSVRFGLLFL